MIRSVTDMAGHMANVIVHHMTFEGVFLMHPINQDGTIELSRYERPAHELLANMVEQPDTFIDRQSVALGVATSQGRERKCVILTIDGVCLFWDQDEGACWCTIEEVRENPPNESTQLILDCHNALRAIRQALMVTQVSLN